MAMAMAPVQAVPVLVHFSSAALYAVKIGSVAVFKVLRTIRSSSAPLSCRSNINLISESNMMASVFESYDVHMQGSMVHKFP